MIIIETPHRVPFSELGDGDVFRLGGSFYMKTVRIDLASGVRYSAVGLSDGQHLSVAASMSVHPVSGRFVLERG